MKTDPVRNPLATTRIAEPEVETVVDTYEEISSRAYELYLERGQEDGHALEDWLQAEAEILPNRNRKRAA